MENWRHSAISKGRKWNRIFFRCGCKSLLIQVPVDNCSIQQDARFAIKELEQKSIDRPTAFYRLIWSDKKKKERNRTPPFPYQQFFIHVEVDVDVLGYAIVGDADLRHYVLARIPTRVGACQKQKLRSKLAFWDRFQNSIGIFYTFETKIFKVVDSLGIYQFDIVVDRAPVVFAEVALCCDVIILGRPTNESPLR